MVVALSKLRFLRSGAGSGVGLALGGAALTLLLGCAKVVDPASGGGGNGGHAGPNGAGGQLGAGAGGRPSADGGVRPDTGGTVCQQESFTFDPKIPTVFVLVDQSGSMFGCISKNGALDAPNGRECANHADTAWYPLRDGVLQVMSQLQDKVRFGFSSFGGEQPNKAPPACPAMNPVQPAL